jgi:hypothetical protein
MNLFGQNDAQFNTKTTQLHPEFSGFNCVGLLIKGSPGRPPGYPLFSRPMISVLLGELICLGLLQHATLGTWIEEGDRFPGQVFPRRLRISPEGCSKNRLVCFGFYRESHYSLLSPYRSAMVYSSRADASPMAVI